MSNILRPHRTEGYEEHKKSRYIEFLNELGTRICFNNDTWVCNKRIRSFAEDPNIVSIYFSSMPDDYRTIAKYFAIIRMMNGKSVRGIRANILDLAVLFRSLPKNIKLSEINMTMATEYKAFLDQAHYTETSRYTRWSVVSIFLKTMNGWEGEHFKNPFANNPYDSHKKLDYKYIPEDVAKQLDTVFMRDEIDLTIKCIYWILRLIPSRIGEVQGMRIDCLKPYDGHFCLFIPTWKQNGGNKEPIQRVIHIEDTGIGGYLIGLIREQQALAKSLQPFMADNKKDALFTYQVKYALKNGTTTTVSRYQTAQWGYVSYNFKNICEKYNIRDENGEIYHLTSHQFRHNGITDRLEAGFTLPQIADMTGHHGDAMLFGSYVHLDLKPKTLVQKQKYVLNEQENSENPYVMFGGRILNMEEQLEKRLLKNIRAHRVRGGICGDITGCKSDMWNCLGCKHFIPDREQLPYFREQVLLWQTKAEKFKDYPMINTNALRNTELFEKIVKKIMDGDYYA